MHTNVENLTSPQNRGTTGGQKPPQGRRFTRGISGNPGGRPKGFGRYIREATRNGKELVDIVLTILRAPKTGPKVRLEAAVWLSDRGFGIPQGRQDPFGDEDWRQVREDLLEEEDMLNLGLAEVQGIEMTPEDVRTMFQGHPQTLARFQELTTCTEYPELARRARKILVYAGYLSMPEGGLGGEKD